MSDVAAPSGNKGGRPQGPSEKIVDELNRLEGYKLFRLVFVCIREFSLDPDRVRDLLQEKLPNTWQQLHHWWGRHPLQEPDSKKKEAPAVPKKTLITCLDKWTLGEGEGKKSIGTQASAGEINFLNGVKDRERGAAWVGAGLKKKTKVQTVVVRKETAGGEREFSVQTKVRLLSQSTLLAADESWQRELDRVRQMLKRTVKRAFRSCLIVRKTELVPSSVHHSLRQG
uniref:Uncharacterized protein n=1 Tax=Chromera velia CCMP2878 TaxID=1169474 RepID=A0A0G4HWX6_9ALVE|eukprot:Cvel_32819.t1-p1 / transcript=Cvel_32819.t1 / gene=Cvel_32819 / organism=Chromera_velia_CCMP2878 / gene_product=hypothetical protein / transcript_product=hypothetical protein / location=Cvel_scaffold5191:5335-6012(+) / protein_length=226 / sequence_SO=supercontig / SO=protein_coding / is_pseudo=false